MAMDETQKSRLRSTLQEVGTVGLVLSFIGSEATFSGVSVFLAKLAGLPGQDAINPILSVLLTSFPLTISVAIIYALYKRGELTILKVVYIPGAAALASWILNIVLDLGIPQVPFRTNLCSVPGIGVSYIYNYLTIYGPFPFIKSLILGYFFGKWYLRLADIAAKTAKQ